MSPVTDYNLHFIKQVIKCDISSNVLFFTSSQSSIIAMQKIGHIVKNSVYPFFNVVNGISKEGQCISAVSDARKRGGSAGYWPCLCLHRQLLETGVVIHQAWEEVRVETKGQRSLSARPVDTINSNMGWLCTMVCICPSMSTFVGLYQTRVTVRFECL